MIIDWGTQHQIYQGYHTGEIGLVWSAYVIGFIMELFPRLAQQYKLEINIKQQYDLETKITS